MNNAGNAPARLTEVQPCERVSLCSSSIIKDSRVSRVYWKSSDAKSRLFTSIETSGYVIQKNALVRCYYTWRDPLGPEAFRWEAASVAAIVQDYATFAYMNVAM